jgi:uncharacterized protein
MKNIKYLISGIFFGIILTKSEVISWFRIQEMFRFDGIHMYGVIFLAIVVGIVSTLLIRKFSLKTMYGEKITIEKRPFHKGAIYGGLIFGLGWAFTGACPGPLFALIGNGYGVFMVALLFAILGTWVYGYFQSQLPH